MKTEKAIIQEKKDFKNIGKYTKKLNKQSGKLLFKKRYISSLLLGVLLSGVTAGYSLIASAYGLGGMFKSKIKKAYYTKKINDIKNRFDKLDEKAKGKKEVKLKKRTPEVKKEAQKEVRKTITNLDINSVACNVVFNSDGTYSMSREQLKYLNTVQEKETMNKDNLDKICKMYGETNTNTNPAYKKILKKAS